MLASFPSYNEAMFLLEQGIGLTIQSQEISALVRLRAVLVFLLWIIRFVISHTTEK